MRYKDVYLDDNNKCIHFWCSEFCCPSYSSHKECYSCENFSDCGHCIWIVNDPRKDCHDYYKEVIQAISAFYDYHKDHEDYE